MVKAKLAPRELRSGDDCGCGMGEIAVETKRVSNKLFKFTYCDRECGFFKKEFLKNLKERGEK